MKLTLKNFSAHDAQPLHLIENALAAREWEYERVEGQGIVVELNGRWCFHRLYFIWREDHECLITNSIVPIRVPDTAWGAVGQVISLMNPKLWIGHFELSPEEEYPSFRYNLTLRGTMGLTFEQLEDLFEAVILECDRFYSALQFVLEGDKSPQDAVFAAMLDTVGEA